MHDIEFFEAVPPAPGPPRQDPAWIPRERLRTVSSALAALGCLIAAAIALVAPLGALYFLRIAVPRAQDQSINERVDGWGRVRTRLRVGSGNPTYHETRYGLVLAGAAAALLLAALLIVLALAIKRAQSVRVLNVVTRMLAVSSAGALIAMAAVEWLDVSAVRDNYGKLLQNTPGYPGHLDITVSSAFWGTIAAAGVAVAAAVGVTFATRTHAPHASQTDSSAVRIGPLSELYSQPAPTAPLYGGDWPTAGSPSTGGPHDRSRRPD